MIRKENIKRKDPAQSAGSNITADGHYLMPFSLMPFAGVGAVITKR